MNTETNRNTMTDSTNETVKGEKTMKSTFEILNPINVNEHTPDSELLASGNRSIIVLNKPENVPTFVNQQYTAVAFSTWMLLISISPWSRNAQRYSR